MSIRKLTSDVPELDVYSTDLGSKMAIRGGIIKYLYVPPTARGIGQASELLSYAISLHHAELRVHCDRYALDVVGLLAKCSFVRVGIVVDSTLDVYRHYNQEELALVRNDKIDYFQQLLED